MVVLLGAVLALATLPALAYADTTYRFAVDSAQYDWDDNTLMLNFTGRVNIWNIDVSQVGITDGVCAIAFTWKEYESVSQDRHAITIRPTDIQRETLAGMVEPYIQFRNGSFHEEGTGMMLEPFEMLLDMSGAPPHRDVKCVITYGYSDALLESYAHDHNQTSQAVHDGFTAWSDLNPYLEFVHTEQDPLVWVDWVDYSLVYIGQACFWCLDNDPTMEIVLYGYDCKGGRIHHDPNTIRNTVAHELGHILGLDHHTNTTHLMYGSEYQIDPYETYGYVVPGPLPELFVGEAELHERLQILGDELDDIDAKLIRLEARGDLVGDTLYFDTQSQVNQYNRLLKEYNDLVGVYNTLVDELNCMYEASDPWHSAPDVSDLEAVPP